MKNNFKSEILERAMIALNCKKVNDIAMLLKVSPQNLNGYLDRGTFIKLASNEFYKRNINIDWIKTGQGNMTSGHETRMAVGETQSTYTANPPANPPVKISDLLQKTAAVLESPSIFSAALKSNIEAFHQALSLRQELKNAQAEIIQHEARLKAVEERLSAGGEK